MEHFTAHRLRFECEVITPLRLNEHTGSAIRGSFFHALWDQFCMNHDAPACPACPLVAACPVAFLVSTLDPKSDRGANVPRPYTVQPPLDGKTDYAPGDMLTFGLTMYARALNLFPYVVLAMQRLEHGGLGKRVAANGGRRGQFHIRRVWAENPLTGENREVLRQGETMVQVPDVPITHEQILNCQWPIDNCQLTIELLTPLRLIDNGQLVKRMAFRPFVQRLHQRLRQLAAEYSDTPVTFDLRTAMDRAEAVRVVRDETGWVELESYSTRLGRATPIGGLIGRVTFEGDPSLCSGQGLRPFWPELLWGQFTHVGKDAVKGNGWYQFSNAKCQISKCAGGENAE